MADPSEPLPEELVRIVAPHFVAGLVMKGDTCVHAAPILLWAIGWRTEKLRAFFAHKKWLATRLPNREKTS